MLRCLRNARPSAWCPQPPVPTLALSTAMRCSPDEALQESKVPSAQRRRSQLRILPASPRSHVLKFRTAGWLLCILAQGVVLQCCAVQTHTAQQMLSCHAEEPGCWRSRRGASSKKRVHDEIIAALQLHDAMPGSFTGSRDRRLQVGLDSQQQR